MFEIPTGLPAELVPLSWLLGVWEGTGVLDYAIGENRVQHEFGQRVSFSHDGMPYLNYTAFSWLLADRDSAGESAPLAAETGYWRLSRPRVDGDPGPAMLPGVGAPPFTDAETVETLRNDSGGFDIEALIVHPDGVSELYLGTVAGPRIDLSTDAVMRTAGAKNYAAATRMYGLVESHLLWAWDIAALGQELRTHASARLSKVQ
ncbi:MAG: FABP family protein [Microbacteriaceae bacterium]|nr:MAG: FABP family protein [Microbacteriaceae bacterium]